LFQIDHAASYHNRTDDDQDMWQLVSDEEVSIAKTLEETSIEAVMRDYEGGDYWSCSRCRLWGRRPKAAIKEHVIRE
jgi:hypothetical protein